MNTLPFLLIALVVSVLLSGLVIWLVGKLELGLEVDSFGSALVAGVLIGVVAGVATVAFGLLGMADSTGFFGGMLHFIVTVIALLISDRLLPGLRVTRFGGVLLAAALIGAAYWLGGLALARLI